MEKHVWKLCALAYHQPLKYHKISVFVLSNIMWLKGGTKILIAKMNSMAP